jgi:hypothetical protein
MIPLWSRRLVLLTDDKRSYTLTLACSVPRARSPSLSTPTVPPRDHQRLQTLELVERRAYALADQVHAEYGTERGADLELTRSLVIEQGIRCWQMLAGPDTTASLSEQRRLLERVLAEGDFSVSLRDRLDNATWARIATHYDGDKIAFWHSEVLDSVAIERAVRAAFNDLPASSRGRPPGTWSLARLQLAHGLAFVWWRITGSRPTRLHDNEHNAYGGRFRDFVVDVVHRLPAGARPVRKGGRPDVDDLMRVAIAAFRRAERQGRMLSLRSIDEDLWRGPLPSGSLSREALDARYAANTATERPANKTP